jgi:phospholipid/cholesterol/gamma-HCH transport system permease protein
MAEASAKAGANGWVSENLLAPFRAIGGKFFRSIFTSGYDLVMLWRATLWIRSAWGKRQEILNQCFIVGIESLPVTLIVTMFTGMILALQAGIQLAKYGQQDVIGALVSISLAREMAPFMTGLILAAQVGSAIAAEIGTMAVSEEIEALEVMSIDVTRFLVMPRLVAMMFMAPTLTIIANLVGNLGGALIAYTKVGVTFSSYYQNAVHLALETKDIYTGLFKAWVFGVVIATIACGKGLRTKGGALGVGEATRTSVISCFVMIIILGFFITSVFYGGSLTGGD